MLYFMLWVSDARCTVRVILNPDLAEHFIFLIYSPSVIFYHRRNVFADPSSMQVAYEPIEYVALFIYAQ